MTLPLGPVQTSPIWFARSRLGINIFACKVWGHGIDDAAGVWEVLCARVAEHTAEYSIATFATLDSAAEGIIANKVIDDLPVLVSELQAWAARLAPSPYRAKFMIEEFWPEEKSSYTFHDLKEPRIILIYFVTITVSAYCHRVFSFVI